MPEGLDKVVALVLKTFEKEGCKKVPQKMGLPERNHEVCAFTLCSGPHRLTSWTFFSGLLEMGKSLSFFEKKSFGHV